MPGDPDARIEGRDSGDGAVLTARSQPGNAPGPAAAPGLVEHFFRHEYGRLVAMLTRRAGVRHVEIVEDAVQSALMAALTEWTAHGLPGDPGAWLYRVAYNRLIGDLRQKAGRLRILERAAGDIAESTDQVKENQIGRVSCTIHMQCAPLCASIKRTPGSRSPSISFHKSRIIS
jgi:hypothetical protein